MSHASVIILLWGGAIAFLIMAAILDLKRREIPNWLTLIAALYAMACWGCLSDWKAASANLGIGLGAGFLLYLCRMIGAGDAKALAALSAMIGPAAMFMTLAGAFCAIILYIVPKRVLRLGLKGFLGCERQGLMHFLCLRSLDAGLAPPDVERVPLAPFFLPGFLLALLFH
jgi:Flp pilus assembly protein protease CpaA